MAMIKITNSSTDFPPSVHEKIPSHTFLFFQGEEEEKVDEPDADKTELIKLIVCMNPDNPA
jgi:hypothetical protein